MFHHLAYNIFDGIKLEPLNYYINGNEDTYPHHSHYGAFITPEVTITCEESEESKQTVSKIRYRHIFFYNNYDQF